MKKINTFWVLLSLFCVMTSNGNNVAMLHLKSDFSQLNESQKHWNMSRRTISYNIYCKEILENSTSMIINVDIDEITQLFELDYLEGRVEQKPKSIEILHSNVLFWLTRLSKDEIIKLLEIGSIDAYNKLPFGLYSSAGPAGPVSTCYLYSIDNDRVNLYIISVMTHWGKKRKNIHLSGYEIFHTIINLNDA